MGCRKRDSSHPAIPFDKPCEGAGWLRRPLDKGERHAVRRQARSLASNRGDLHRLDSSAARRLLDAAVGDSDRCKHSRLEALGRGDDDAGLFVSGSGVGSGVLAFRGKTYPFTLIGSLIGLGALSTMQASGEVYKLNDVSQFPGAWIQGTGSLAITTKATGEIWLENRNGVIMRLTAAQAGLTFSSGRYEIFIQLSP
jgi:hypothetical protein